MLACLPTLAAGLLAAAGAVWGTNPGSVAEPTCDGQVMVRSVGYYDARAASRSCDRRMPSDIDILPFTHINFAYAYFHPTTFEILPMQAGDEALYIEFTALKLKKPSLKTRISIGGKTFSERTNTPDTQTAFSDMTNSATNRQHFIDSLRKFMTTYAFDGVDIDWQYPSTDRRSDNTTDIENLITLLHDLKEAFADSKIDISLKVPGNNTLLSNFNLTAIQPHIDFFNFATYDIHDPIVDRGFAFPSSSFDQVRKQLGVQRIRGVDLEKVNLGFGWYARSFTLKDPECNTSGCFSTSFGRTGECTRLSGVLSHAEMYRIIKDNDLMPAYDAHAVAKMLTWDTDQWASFDDAETMRTKIGKATSLCVGGINVWSVDLDDQYHKSSNDLLRALGAIVPAGASSDDIEAIRDYREVMDRQETIEKACYWSFCGETCATHWLAFTHSKGQVPGLSGDLPCRGDDVRTLCCAPGSSMGRCDWFGWRGVGMPCAPRGCPVGKELVARNTNFYMEDPELAVNENHTCNGMFQGRDRDFPPHCLISLTTVLELGF
ncbi:glycoside hydrolase family 18 protein [Aspergillus stella-maris]|uniref:glycoside hydrolase family 18 protein n=1 Tax=Aspergillus stella-maris TaxID=1810926 RepID=UPI003CCDC620